MENDHDASTAAALEAVERRGEMVVRLIEPRQMGRQGSEAAKKFLALQVIVYYIVMNKAYYETLLFEMLNMQIIFCK